MCVCVCRCVCVSVHVSIMCVVFVQWEVWGRGMSLKVAEYWRHLSGSVWRGRGTPGQKVHILVGGNGG